MRSPESPIVKGLKVQRDHGTGKGIWPFTTWEFDVYKTSDDSRSLNPVYRGRHRNWQDAERRASAQLTNKQEPKG